MHLQDTRILLGVTGGIAAYKSAELVRELCRAGAQVDVVMSQNAQEFITPLTFEALSGHPVITDTFALGEGQEMNHIVLAEACTLFLVAPATANLLGKLAHGIADDALTTMALVADGANKPSLLAPAMNAHMYISSAVQANLDILIGRGYRVVGPDVGDLACGYTGPGRMAEVPDILEAAKAALAPQDLAGRRILVTAGPTREPFDPVRFLSNRSSGKMGYHLARAAARRGAQVTLVSGPTALPEPPTVETFIAVETTAEMEQAVLEHARECEVLIMCAAVADYAPVVSARTKEPRHQHAATRTIEVKQTPDIITQVGTLKRRPRLVGFAAETDNVVEKAGAKLERKNLDLIVANPVGTPESGFDVDTNKATILDRTGVIEELPVLDKEELAEIVLTHVGKMLESPQPGVGTGTRAAHAP